MKAGKPANKNGKPVAIAASATRMVALRYIQKREVPSAGPSQGRRVPLGGTARQREGAISISRRIAIVEDEPAIRANYAEALRRHGYEVATYAARAEALSAFRTRLPDLALV